MQPNHPMCTDYCPNKKRAKTIFLFWKLFLWIDLWSGWSILTTWALVTIWIWLLLASTVISKFAFFTLFFFLFSRFCYISFAIIFFYRPEKEIKKMKMDRISFFWQAPKGQKCGKHRSLFLLLLLGKCR